MWHWERWAERIVRKSCLYIQNFRRINICSKKLTPSLFPVIDSPYSNAARLYWSLQKNIHKNEKSTLISPNIFFVCASHSRISFTIFAFVSLRNSSIESVSSFLVEIIEKIFFPKKLQNSRSTPTAFKTPKQNWILD